MPGPLASLVQVTARFGERTVLHGISLEVRRGEVLGLLGPNGAGKTTALRILTGLLAPASGRVEIDGRDLGADPIGARKRFSFVPDGAPLYANLNPREHLRLAGRLHGLDEAAIEREGARLLAALDLEAHSGRALGGFSRGMRQKVALACALLPAPPLLVLDEPLSGLDTPSAAAVQELLRLWAGRGGGVLYTSHALGSAEQVCDRLAILDQGRITAEGSLRELQRLAGREAGLEAVFRVLTRSPDPADQAREILGPLAPSPAP